MAKNIRVLWVPCLFMFVASSASAETWVMLDFQTRQVSVEDAQTFQDLLQSELSRARGVQFVRPGTACTDLKCAASQATQNNATMSVNGAIGRLGEKIIVTVELVDDTGELRRSERMSVTQIEELDVVATRFAHAFANNQNVAKTAELGTITSDEVPAPKRREGFGGLALGVGALFPVHGYAEVPFGVAIDAAYWYETPYFAVGPRTGIRFQADPNGEDHFVEIPFDIGAYVVFGLGDIAPFIGGGAGLRYISDTRRAVLTTGSVITTTHEANLDESAWGLGTYARAGVLLFRTYTVRVSLSIDYNATFIELHGQSVPQSFTAMITTHF